MNITIEHAKIDDVEALVELLNILFSIEQDFSPNETAQRDGLQLLIGSPQQGQIFVARHQQEGIVGMVSAQLVISTAVGAPSVWIEDMVVCEPFRGQGLGKALLEKAQAWAKEKGAKRMQLVADADNAPALNYYQHLEWQPTRLFALKKMLNNPAC
jgi:GNAT superfamily N-acetyltransferase